MTARLAQFGLITFAIVAISCTISMMSVFLTGEAGGTDLRSLLLLQVLAVPPAIAVSLYETWRQGAVAIWRALSPWIVLGALLLNGLVVVGELALLLRGHLTGRDGTWFEHAPLLAALSCSAAACVLYARRFPAAADASGGVRRW